MSKPTYAPRLTFDAWRVVFERSLSDDEELLMTGPLADRKGLCELNRRMERQFVAEWRECGDVLRRTGSLAAGLLAPVVEEAVSMDADSYYLTAVVYLPACVDSEAALGVAVDRIQSFYDEGSLSGHFVVSGRVEVSP